MNKQLYPIFLCLFLCFFATASIAQNTPCDDTKAKNTGQLEPCEYRSKRKIFRKTTRLDDVLNETSGLLYDKGYIWTHNDGGGEAALYKIDPQNGKIVQKVSISNAKNVDWEELAQDEHFIYIGDFGNNYGMRKDLTIYKIKRADIDEKTRKVQAQIITFVYPEQVNFQGSNTHNFDCEGFFVWKNELHLFTKNRGDGKTQHYTLSTIEGNHKANLKSTFNTKGQITAADISPDGKTIVLTGYTPRKLFMWICKDYKKTQFFSGKNRRIRMGRFVLRGQMEGVCFSGKDEGYISAEQIKRKNFNIKKQHLRYFSLKKYL